MGKKIITYCGLIICMLLTACSTTRHLPPGEVLYNGADVHINTDSAGKTQAQEFQQDLESNLRPIPNKKILGFRYKLFFYNLAGTPKKEKGFKYWMKNKLGEPPVLLSDVRLEQNVSILKSRLLSKGFLQSTGTGDTVVNKKNGKAVYEMNSGPRYTINQVTYPDTSSKSEVLKLIGRFRRFTSLRPGRYYDLDMFKTERDRIDAVLKQRGYYYFSPDFLLIQADSTIGNNKVDLFLKLKETSPDAALHPYKIRNVNIFPNYIIQRDSVIRQSSPTIYNNFRIYDRFHRYKSKLFDNLIFFHPGETYNSRDHSLSLNRLVSIGTFKFVKAEFTPVDTLRNYLMDVDFLLTSVKKNSLTASLTGTSKSNNFVGSEVKITRINRNLFRGGEQLNLSLSGGFEKQFSSQVSNSNSYSLGANGDLIFPRFIIPFIKVKTYNEFIPKTHVSLGGQLLNRANYYTLVSGKTEFGYIWKGNRFNEHVLNPVSISYIHTLKTTDSFSRMLIEVPSLKNNFENQFIFGSNYTFTYTNQTERFKRNSFVFMGSAETAGNLINLIIPKQADGKRRLWNTLTNQYVRFETDFRDFYNINRNLIWANRLNIGVGLPYGNSSTLPYVRQFFAGGSNDIRAFRSRSLGPGTFNVNPDSIKLFAEQGGDIKFMVNTELRAKLFGIIQGAAFIDAGNIWLTKTDTSRPGSKFQFGNMLNEIAVGGGIGLRVDASIFVLRLDLAMPFRKPYEPKGSRWVFDKINFGDPAWRKQNLIFNIGIGYPF